MQQMYTRWRAGLYIVSWKWILFTVKYFLLSLDVSLDTLKKIFFEYLAVNKSVWFFDSSSYWDETEETVIPAVLSRNFTKWL